MARDENTQEVAQEEAPKKKGKKLIKEIAETQIKIEAIGGDKGQVVYDFKDLPEDVQAKLGPFGLSHKLGDAAAGKAGKEAEESILRVWEGLMKGDWTTRAPATPKVAVNEITNNLSKLNPQERAAAEALLAKLGVPVPA